MKTTLKVISIILASILIITLGAIIYFYIITKDTKLDSNKLINMEKVVSYYDASGNFLFKEGDEKQVTELKEIPSHVQNAFIAIEDKRFYKHNGVDYKGLFRAAITNLKSFSFKEGGSTISQQLIKNTHLSNQKTFKRKLNEIKLAKKLEKKYSKQEILEKYLNTIYFGDNCYGITKASQHYFGKEPGELSINEGAALAGIIKAPSNYSPYKDLNKCNERKNVVLSQMFEQGYIDKSTYDESLKENVHTIEKEDDNNYDLTFLAKKELNEKIKDYPFSYGNLKVYTTLDSSFQNILNEKMNENSIESDKSSIIINKNGEIKAYYSTCGDISRQVGSTIKPLLVYAPAIENDVVYSSSLILDEKTDFGGYSPSNYYDKYYGHISVKESLAKSLNTCAVKLLNYNGVNKSKIYLKNMDFPFSEKDNSLCLALGATENGATLSQLSSIYTVLINQGEYVSPYTILKVESENNGIIFEKKLKKKRIFSSETSHIINDMLEYTVKEGTAKKLSFLDIPLCSKTGTVGNEKGNLDAYNISYNNELIVSVWLGNKDNKLMNNSITGGTAPTILAGEIWKSIYMDKIPPKSYEKSSGVCEKYIDKIEYNENKNVLLAAEMTPKRYVLKTIFKSNNLPKISDRFLVPKINGAEISINDNKVQIVLNIPEYFNAYIYREDLNGKKLVFDTSTGEKTKFIDCDVIKNCIYSYSIIPYFENEKTIYKGREIFLDKIKTPTENIDEWWSDELV